MLTRRHLMAAGAAALAALPLRSARAQSATVRWWYHFDDPKASPAELIAMFEQQNPGIKIEAESIPWGGGADYDTRLYAALIAGNGPDTAMVKFQNLPRLIEMEALLPIDKYLDAWPARSDISDDLWRLHRAPDGKRYYLPLQYVLLYLYLRQDWFSAKNLTAPTTFAQFLEAAKALTTTTAERWGFGLRGAAGGHDFWASFVLGGGARMEKGGLVAPEALAANRWFIDLHRIHKICPPSAPTDGFAQTINNMKAGRTAMTIHHIGSAKDLDAALGEAITAVPIPRGPQGGWATYGDGSSAIFAASKAPDAAWRWIAFLSTGEANAAFNKLSGQVAVTTSGAARMDHPRRFVEATRQSLAIANVLPSRSETADFTRTVWPQTTQKALLGEVAPDDMMRTFERHFFG